MVALTLAPHLAAAAQYPVVASVSGGKDSSALCLWLKEQGIPFRAVHMDTGWEHPLTDEYIRGPLTDAIGPVEWIVPPRGMADLVRWKGIFASRRMRFCTEQLKIVPLKQWLIDNFDRPVINAIGIRSAESAARGKLWLCDRQEWAWTWRPLLRWTVDDVVAIHHRHGLRPNPLYLHGAGRVGCWPCIFASKAEIRLVARLTPGRIDEIRALERELQKAFFARHAGEEIDTYPTFFTLRDRGSTKHRSAGIDEVVSWSRTSRGGRYAVDEQVDRSGCLRWGVCDA